MPTHHRDTDGAVMLETLRGWCPAEDFADCLQKGIEHLLVRSDYPRERLLDDMEYFVRYLRDSGEWEKENAALEVLDVLTGWCAPSARL